MSTGFEYVIFIITWKKSNMADGESYNHVHFRSHESELNLVDADFNSIFGYELIVKGN